MERVYDHVIILQWKQNMRYYLTKLEYGSSIFRTVNMYVPCPTLYDELKSDITSQR